MGFLRQVTGQKTQLIGEYSWWRVAEERMLQAAGKKTFKTYIDKRQTTVAEWVALHHIFKVYAKEISYE